MSPDADLAEELRKDLTAKHCVEALLKSVSDMADAIGVTISYEVVSVEDIDVDQTRLSEACGRMATATGAMLAGGSINPITILKAQDPIRMIRERKSKMKGGCKDVT